MVWQCVTIPEQDGDVVGRVVVFYPRAGDGGAWHRAGLLPDRGAVYCWDNLHAMTFPSAIPERSLSGQVVTKGEISQVRDESGFKINTCCFGSQQVITCVYSGVLVEQAC